jgi:hypothetical protein
MLKDIVKRLCGAHLEASFGIVPFVKDLIEIFTQLNELDYKLKLLRRYAGRRQTRHYKYVLGLSGDPYGTEKPDNGWHYMEDDNEPWPSPFNILNRPNFVLRTKYRWVQRPVYNATMEYIYSIPRMSEAEAKLLGYLDALGLKLDPAIVWNAIPFSFVVDWVVDVSGFLHSFSRDNFPITVQAVAFCHSTKYHYLLETEIYIPYQSEFNFGPPAVNFVAAHGRETVMKRAYCRTLSVYDRRVPDVNLDAHTISIKSPGSREFFLSGSLFNTLALGSRKTYRGLR